jgi:hypothetical protein
VFEDTIQLQVNLKSSSRCAKKIMDITEVSKASGLPTSTLRFYEEKGLIQSNGRNGLRRLFDAKL